jgi:hypothetical protein
MRELLEDLSADSGKIVTEYLTLWAYNHLIVIFLIVWTEISCQSKWAGLF